MEKDIVYEESTEVAAGELAPVEKKRGFTGKAEKVKRFLEKLGTRNIVIASSVLLIGLAVVLNFVLFGNTSPTVSEGVSLGAGMENLASVNDSAPADAAEESYFASAQLSRKEARDQALAVLLSVVDSQSADKTAKEQASLDISRITTEMEAEANIETLVRSKGFEDCIAVVGEGSASIIVRSDGLLPNELSQIKEIVWEQAGIEPVGIKIIEQSEL